MNVVVFGGSGMLGKQVVREAKLLGHDVEAPGHNECDITKDYDVFSALMGAEVAINCAGSIPQRGDVDYQTNALGPQVISFACSELGIKKFLHVSTDCVFSGKLTSDRKYTTDSKTDASDEYGKSKAIGEAIVGSIIRTSFIGYEHGLLNWLLSAKDSVEGWSSVRWSGSTVYEVARALVNCIELPLPKIAHLAIDNSVTKAEVIRTLINAFKLDLELVIQNEPVINRALVSTLPVRPLTDPEVLQELVDNRP
jgi:dTDP-4-dehydrorhamnose reductase